MEEVAVDIIKPRQSSLTSSGFSSWRLSGSRPLVPGSFILTSNVPTAAISPEYLPCWCLRIDAAIFAAHYVDQQQVLRLSQLTDLTLDGNHDAKGECFLCLAARKLFPVHCGYIRVRGESTRKALACTR
jgi:hypothetical protein